MSSSLLKPNWVPTNDNLRARMSGVTINNAATLLFGTPKTEEFIKPAISVGAASSTSLSNASDNDIEDLDYFYKEIG